MKDNEFLTGKIAPTLIKFSLPLMLSLVLQALYGAVDLVIVGKFADTSSVSAVATGSQVMQSLTVIITGLSMGVTILIGQAMGEKDNKKIGLIISSQIKLFAVITIALTVLIYIFADKLAFLMSVPIEALNSTVEYIRVCSLGMIFIASYNSISGIFRGIGNSKSPFIFVSIACVVNILLDLLFIKQLHMNAFGAALATVIAQAVSVIFSLFYIKFNNLPFKVSRENFKNTSYVKGILKVGGPIVLQDLLTCISFLIITSIVNSLGLIASASVGVAEKMFVFLSLVPMSFMSALSAFVANNVGAKEFKRANKSLRVAISISFVCGVCIFLLTFFAGEVLASIFTSDSLVISSTALYLKGCSFEYIFISISFCLLGYFNGHAKTTFVMAQGLISAFLVRVPLSFYFSRLPNTNMFLISLAVSISALVTFILCIIYYKWLSAREKNY